MNHLLLRTVSLVALGCFSGLATAQTQPAEGAVPPTGSVAPSVAPTPKKPAPTKSAAPGKGTNSATHQKKPTPDGVQEPVEPGPDQVKGAAGPPAVVTETVKAGAKPTAPPANIPAVDPAIAAPGPVPFPETASSSSASPAVSLQSQRKPGDNRSEGKPKLAPAAPIGAPVAITLNQPVSRDNAASSTELSHSSPMLAAWMGVGTMVISAGGFDAFSDNDALTGFAMGLAYSPAGLLPPGFSILGTWEQASTQAEYRGEKTALSSQRFALGAEVRAALIPRVDYYLRVAGTGLRIRAELDESSSGANLRDRLWSFGLDATAGLQVHLLQIPTRTARDVNLFVRAEGGYVWLTKSKLSLASPSSDGPVRLEPIEVAKFDMGGDQFRFAIGINY